MKVFIVLALFAIAQAHPSQDGTGKIKIPEKCSDVLAVKVCTRLNNFATKLKLKSEEVKKAVVEAYKQGKTKSEELYKKSKELLQEKVLSKKCEDLTTIENCQKLRKLAADLKIQADKVSQFVMKEIANLKTKECKDFLSVPQCQQLTNVANKLKVRLDKLQDMMVDAYLDAKTKGTKMLTETYNKVKTYVMSTKCEDVFNPQVCTSFRKYANKTKVALPVIMETAFNLVRRGISIGKTLVQKVYDIVDYFYDCTDVFDVSSCNRMEKWAASLKVKAQEFQLAVKKYVRIAIEKGTSIYKTIKDFVKNKIICKFTKGCVNPEDSDEMAQDEMTYATYADYKEKILKLLKKNFQSAKTMFRTKLETIIKKSKTYYELMVELAKQVRAGASKKWNEFVKQFLTSMIAVKS